MKKIIIALVAIIIIGAGVYYFIKNYSNKVIIQSDNNMATTSDSSLPSEVKTESIIGKSVSGSDIKAYHYGTGTTTEILFVGGIHGGYEWNTVSVAYEAMDYLKANPNLIPTNVKVTVIPVLNPDGLGKVISSSTTRFTPVDVTSNVEKLISGRFNGNNVDLNRNFDCDWKTNATWQNKSVSGGTSAFSEPESQAIKDYVENHKLGAVIVWYSAAGGVFSSSCHNGILKETRNLTNVYAKASGYPAHEEFNFYEITGDMVNWLAKNNIPAISVLLTNHESTEWSKNQAGIEAILKYFSK